MPRSRKNRTDRNVAAVAADAAAASVRPAGQARDEAGRVSDPSMHGLDIVPTSAGVRVRLRVKAGARRSQILREWAGALKVAVQAPPERGRANEEIVHVLAEALGVSRAAVRLVSGHASPDKTAEIDLRDPSDVRRRLAAAVRRSSK